MDDLNKERIKFNIEIIKLLTLLFITTGGGGLALVAEGLDATWEWVLVYGGMTFALGSGILAIAVYRNTLKKLKGMTAHDIFTYIAITGIFLAGFIPIVMGIIYYTRENRRLDKEEREKAQKAASDSGI